ncbi:MAG: hypothetical protein ACTHN0_19875 [Aquihabitans sp.]
MRAAAGQWREGRARRRARPDPADAVWRHADVARAAEAAAELPVESDSRRRRTACFVVGVLWAGLLAPVLWRVSHGPVTGYLFSDWYEHLRLVPNAQLWPPVIPIAHFLFHVLTRTVQASSPWSLRTSGFVVATLAAGLTGATLTWYLQRPWLPGRRRPSALLAGAVAAAFAIAEFPQFLFFKTTAMRDSLLNVSLHQWNTPTTVTAESLQILVLAGTVAALTERRPRERVARWLPVIVVVALCALPAVPLVVAAAMVPWLWRARAPRWAWRRGLLWVTIPVGVGAVLQMVITAGWWEPEKHASLAVKAGGALASLDFWGPGLIALLLPALALLSGGRDLLRHPAMRLGGWALLAGLIAAGSIVETGLRSADGNVARTAFGGFWLIVLVSIRWGVELIATRSTWATWTRRRQVSAVLLALYAAMSFVSGVCLYLEQVGLIVFTGARA